MLKNKESYFVTVHEVLTEKVKDIERVIENISKDSDNKALYNSFG